MTAFQIDFETSTTTAPVEIQPLVARGDGLIPVQVVPMVAHAGASRADAPTGPAATLIPASLLVDYTAALTKHAVKHIRSGAVEYIDDGHAHPTHATCLRCAVLGSTHLRTLAIALLEILALGNTDEDWNNDESASSDQQLISRLQRLAVSEASLAEIYGPRWAEVLLTSLRAESVNLDVINLLTKGEPEDLRISELIHDPVATRHALAAYQLGTVTCPRRSVDEETEAGFKRGRIARRFAVAMGHVAVGEAPSWTDHLPSPPL